MRPRCIRDGEAAERQPRSSREADEIEPRGGREGASPCGLARSASAPPPSTLAAITHRQPCAPHTPSPPPPPPQLPPPPPPQPHPRPRPQALLQFGGERLKAGSGGGMYVAGSPGLGKSMTVREAFRLLSAGEACAGEAADAPPPCSRASSTASSCRRRPPSTPPSSPSSALTTTPSRPRPGLGRRSSASSCRRRRRRRRGGRRRRRRARAAARASQARRRRAAAPRPTPARSSWLIRSAGPAGPVGACASL